MGFAPVRVGVVWILTTLWIVPSHAEWILDQQKEARVWVQTANPRRTVIWSGGHNTSGEANAKGTLQIFFDAKLVATYQGVMQNGRMDGLVTASYHKTQQKYVGEIAGWEENGLGTMWFSNGEMKKGLWRAGQFMEAIEFDAEVQKQPAQVGVAVSNVETSIKNEVTSLPASVEHAGSEKQASSAASPEAGNSISKTAGGQSLEELLGGEKTGLTDSKAETRQIWENLLNALGENKFPQASEFASQLDSTRDFVEPYQRTFTSILLEMLAPRGHPASSGDKRFSEPLLVISKSKEEIEQCRLHIGTLNAKRPAILKRIANNQTGGRIGGIFVKELATEIAGSNIKNAERELDEIDKGVAGLQKNIAAAQEQIIESEQAIIRLRNESHASVSDMADKFREKVFSFLVQMKEGGKFRAVGLLTNAYIRNVAEDEVMAKIAQECVNNLKRQAKALAIAEAAVKPVKEALQKEIYWTAKSELARASEMIKQRVSDQLQLDFIKAEISPVMSDVESKLKEALKKRDIILDFAERDAREGSRKLEEFCTLHPDYPDAERDRLRVSDYRQQQLQGRLDRRLTAIEQVVSNDPGEAKIMIKRLVADETDPDEVSIVKAKVAALESRVWERQVGLIQARLNEAHSYLTRYNAAYAQSIVSGREPPHSMPLRTDNLEHARGIVSGVAGEIDLLLKEEMPNVIRAKLVGIVANSNTTLTQMDITLGAHTTLVRLIYVVGLGGLAVLIFGVIWRIRKSRSLKIGDSVP